jgi:hypothetical protein
MAIQADPNKTNVNKNATKSSSPIAMKTGINISAINTATDIIHNIPKSVPII